MEVVENVRLHNIETDPLNADSDGDGMNDGREFSCGFDPTVNNASDNNPRNDLEADFDNDGLSNLDEYLNGTDPRLPDTDGDGVTDRDEVSNGSNPVDCSDGGRVPPREDFRDVTFSIDGDYAAWEMTIKGLGPKDRRVRRISMVKPSDPQSVELAMRKGNSYLLSMRWLNCEGHESDTNAPWYCWSAQIDGLPSRQSFDSYSNERLQGVNELIVGNGWVAENDSGLLTAHVHENEEQVGNVAKGKIAILHVLDYRFLTPAGDPVSAPCSSGAGQNEFTYDDPTESLSMTLRVEVTPALPHHATLTGRFSLPFIGGASLEWAPENPYGEVSSETAYSFVEDADVQTFTAHATYRGYPTHNSGFGRKTVTFECGGNTISQDFEVFFPKKGTHHPPCSTCADCPNWFYYWREGGVCGINENCRYDGTISYGLTKPSLDKLIRLGPEAAEDNSGPETYTNTCTHAMITVTGQGKGIQCVAETIQHEQHHIDTYNRFHSQGNDPDGDGIPTSEEASYDGISSSPNDSDTYNLKAESASYQSYGDNEVRCRKIEVYPEPGKQIPYYPNLAWANPGCQHKERFGPTVQ
ncbi:MAG: thrombospondin type 3 repeat-containing protein [Kiritimatiellae bacterium]|nr:thrombospondin type 3 repeat-containing protein [Kiritimatiellia bacterium]